MTKPHYFEVSLKMTRCKPDWDVEAGPCRKHYRRRRGCLTCGRSNITTGNAASRKEYVKFNGGLQVSFRFVGTAGVFFYTPSYLFGHSVRVPSLWADCCLVLKLLRNIRPGFQFLGWHNGCATAGVFKCAGPWRGFQHI